MDRCVTCQFYDRHGRGADKTGNAGQCRRQAPALSPINQKSYMIEGVWPTVRDDDWCGEWKVLVRRVDPARIGEALGTTLASAMPPGAPRRVGLAMPPPRVPTGESTSTSTGTSPPNLAASGDD